MVAIWLLFNNNLLKLVQLVKALTGTVVNRLSLKSSSTKLVNWVKASSAMAPSLHRGRKSFCKLINPRSWKAFDGRIWKLLVLRSRTWVEGEIWFGIDIKFWFSQIVVCFPFLHIHEHTWGHIISCDWMQRTKVKRMMMMVACDQKLGRIMWAIFGFEFKNWRVKLTQFAFARYYSASFLKLICNNKTLIEGFICVWESDLQIFSNRRQFYLVVLTMKIKIDDKKCVTMHNRWITRYANWEKKNEKQSWQWLFSKFTFVVDQIKIE